MAGVGGVRAGGDITIRPLLKRYGAAGGGIAGPLLVEGILARGGSRRGPRPTPVAGRSAAVTAADGGVAGPHAKGPNGW